jgi:DNA-binding NarL/FixJ family response regulator
MVMAGDSSGPVARSLTAREREVLEHVVLGLSNKQIAAKLRMSRGTVRAHLHSAFLKLDASNRTEAAVRYLALREE